ncbi:recombinase RecT [Chelatococcus asaccharovorans]|uniref:RecT family protein n=1 Tax=Chelatococcus asaccharovorans TaxID=28210 RepID=A0A2V3UBV4_9HYPH|nr:recombinase RecT [Chelatococcus asaccharovorans]MBS7703266.1 recombinase RecT [Chelatococcus asaccharovorans]PXW61598.1 RecT family protein [Chelatococcus asaccharovorans]
MSMQITRSEGVPIQQTQGGGTLAPRSMGEVLKAAELMANAGPAVPKHCRKEPGVCFAILMRALRWEMDPFAVASKSYLVNDIIAYEAQLINAVVNARAGLKGLLKVEYFGEGADRSCRITGEFRSGEIRTYDSPKFKDIKVKNSPLWVADTDQQFFYYASRAWARRWCPEVILGLVTPDEAKEISLERTEYREVDRVTALPKDNPFEDNPLDDPDAPDATAPLLHRYSYALEQAKTEDEVKAIALQFDDEISEVFPDDREPIRNLYAAHLKRTRGDAPEGEVMAFSMSLREQVPESVR